MFDFLGTCFSLKTKSSAFLTESIANTYIRMCYFNFVKIYSHISNSEIVKINQKVVKKLNHEKHEQIELMESANKTFSNGFGLNFSSAGKSSKFGKSSSKNPNEGFQKGKPGKGPEINRHKHSFPILLSKMYLKVTLNIALNRNEAVKTIFYQFRVMEFFYKEIDLEFELSQIKERFLKIRKNVQERVSQANSPQKSKEEPQKEEETVKHTIGGNSFSIPKLNFDKGTGNEAQDSSSTSFNPPVVPKFTNLGSAIGEAKKEQSLVPNLSLDKNKEPGKSGLGFGGGLSLNLAGIKRGEDIVVNDCQENVGEENMESSSRQESPSGYQNPSQMSNDSGGQDSSSDTFDYSKPIPTLGGNPSSGINLDFSKLKDLSSNNISNNTPDQSNTQGFSLKIPPLGNTSNVPSNVPPLVPPLGQSQQTAPVIPPLGGNSQPPLVPPLGSNTGFSLSLGNIERGTKVEPPPVDYAAYSGSDSSSEIDIHDPRSLETPVKALPQQQPPIVPKITFGGPATNNYNPSEQTPDQENSVSRNSSSEDLDEIEIPEPANAHLMAPSQNNNITIPKLGVPKIIVHSESPQQPQPKTFKPQGFGELSSSEEEDQFPRPSYENSYKKVPEFGANETSGTGKLQGMKLNLGGLRPDNSTTDPSNKPQGLSLKLNLNSLSQASQGEKASEEANFINVAKFNPDRQHPKSDSDIGLACLHFSSLRPRRPKTPRKIFEHQQSKASAFDGQFFDKKVHERQLV